ncbi:cytidylyltransferase domain-containing protein [Halobacillus halophilus]|uniref:acylneuraminate cytidylyltransferase family protein n=1 Tax=Halobacillus halophilus TaxID=1570 RepID=UPI001CD31AEA|nr:acylneuraminate cytidylyltransferase family protein [Halobacillus halophilus]MCA1012701.1 acylneuraminate cytidylyltransferase family protein [Halobacillus halophilus]
MIKGKKVLGVIPARGGSKGVIRKNIRKISGKPLIAWTIEEAQKSIFIDRLIVSSEDWGIIHVATEWGAEVPFVRPRELALDETPGIAPVLHALEEIEGYDYIVLLQPTSPLRKAEDIDQCLMTCINNQANACITVVETSKHPDWMYYQNQDYSLTPVLPGDRSVRRQDQRPAYAVNGAVYAAKVEWLKKTKDFYKEGETISYVMSQERSYDIDTYLDFTICEFLLSERNK